MGESQGPKYAYETDSARRKYENQKKQTSFHYLS